MLVWPSAAVNLSHGTHKSSLTSLYSEDKSLARQSFCCLFWHTRLCFFIAATVEWWCERFLHVRISIALSFFAFLSWRDGQYSSSKYLTLRLKLNKRIEIINGMNLSLGRFSGHYLILRLAQELIRIVLEKTLDSLFTMVCSKTNLRTW